MPRTLPQRSRTLMAALLLGTLGLGTVATLTAPAQPAQAADYTGAQAGDLVDVRIGDVRPTQPALGYDEVFYKLGRYTMGKDAINKKFGDWCEANGQGDVASAKPGARLDDPTSFTCTVALGAETADTIAPMKTVVVGPGGTLYLTDGHHTLTSFSETPDGGLDLHVRLRVLGNLSSLNEQQFWAKMIENKWTWLRGPEGDAVTPEQLPKNVGLANFRNDNYRSVLYFGRDIGYTSGSLPFQEFYWGSWVRDAKPVDLSGWDRGDLTSYLATVRALTTAQTGLADGAVVDSGFTAAQLGKLGQWNDGKAEGKGEWSKLAKPYSDAKPGKIAYALEYRAANLPVTPAAPTVTAAAGEASVSWSVPASGDRPVTGYTVRLDPVQPAVADSVAAPAASASIVAEVAAPATSHRFTDVPAGSTPPPSSRTTSWGTPRSRPRRRRSRCRRSRTPGRAPTPIPDPPRAPTRAGPRRGPPRAPRTWAARTRAARPMDRTPPRRLSRPARRTVRTTAPMRRRRTARAPGR
ncbi:ParB/Srx family N-terminal domain-containing protein [Leucobacter sp. HNU]|uniref:ParB/Srx family N-terminal domain-containing protein n=1 Tax=Leucobacter sp. HNU TaxID=3236805 RepID=UPI003A812B41